MNEIEEYNSRYTLNHCVICLDNIDTDCNSYRVNEEGDSGDDDENNKIYVLNKICLCSDSLICNNCILHLKNNNVKRCPICRNSLKFKKKYYWWINFKIALKKQKYLLLYIFCLLFSNISLFIKYYTFRDDLPSIKNVDDDGDIYKTLVSKCYNIDVDKLNENKSNDTIETLYFNKTLFFFILNLVYIVFIPVSSYILNLILFKLTVRKQNEITNAFMMILIVLNLFITIINVIITNNKHNLEFYFKLLCMSNVFVLLGLICIYYIIIYYRYLKYIKGRFMIITVDYKIYDKLFIDNNTTQEQILPNNRLNHELYNHNSRTRNTNNVYMV